IDKLVSRISSANHLECGHVWQAKHSIVSGGTVRAKWLESQAVPRNHFVEECIAPEESLNGATRLECAKAAVMQSGTTRAIVAICIARLMLAQQQLGLIEMQQLISIKPFITIRA